MLSLSAYFSRHLIPQPCDCWGHWSRLSSLSASQQTFPTTSAQNISPPPLFPHRKKFYHFQEAPEGSLWIISISPGRYIKVSLLPGLGLLTNNFFSKEASAGGTSTYLLCKEGPDYWDTTKLCFVSLWRSIVLFTQPQKTASHILPPRRCILIHALASINWHCSEDSIDSKLLYFSLSIWDLVLRLYKNRESKSPQPVLKPLHAHNQIAEAQHLRCWYC